MGKKPARKRGARRLNVTPELLANIRHRYEHSAERLATMAADLKCCTETVRAIGKREGWVRYEPPPRDLSPAARLRMKAEALAKAKGSEPLPLQQTPFVPAHSRPKDGVLRTPMRGIQGRDGKALPCGPGSPLSRGRTDDEGPLARERTDSDEPAAPKPEQAASLHAAATEQLLHEAAGFLDDVRAERKRMKREGYAKHELQDVARVIADLSASLKRLQPLAQRAAEPDTGNAHDDSYDDRPADLDAFREDLARQIDALLAEPPDEGDAAQAGDAHAAAAQA